MRNMHFIVIVVAIFLLGGVPANAQRGGDAGDELRRRLFTTDSDVVLGTLQELAFEPSSEGALAIGERIRFGLPMNLLLAAMDTLRAMQVAEAGPALVQLTQHRRSEIRLLAVQGLLACQPPGVERVLEVSLADSDPSVRSAAAAGLGQVGASGAVSSLFLALERGVLEAAVALGQVADESGIRRLLGYLGQVPFDSITPALSEALVRRDLPMSLKLEVIGNLEELGTDEVRFYLEALGTNLTSSRDTPVRRAIESASVRLGGVR